MLEALVFTFFIELGWIPNQGVMLPECEAQVEDIWYLDMNAYLEWHFLWLEAGVKIYSWPTGWGDMMPSFWPARIDLPCGFGFLAGPIRVGMRHLCSHSADPYMRITDPVDGFFNEIFLRVGGSIERCRR